ncbi:trimeric intracellular cation channel family protein [Asticcacaulis sp. SL142]|uniref:trimeric intracellular cation channel family protein n=1 Tax=Asticcacaulis sp. SL142 TaxID=2995155 RepID=UPI00226CF332|nr:trimeric intracellular cation channel family protein [Asticcacaulis sp. SL142]WAC48863.1 trimeric intracellular cation channel family protein [Asticcacaulis sp. SL142]
MLNHIIDPVVHWLNLAGTVVFAVSGGLVAARKNLDIISFILVGTITAIGGGTLRDLLLGVSPVGWVGAPHILWICLISAALTYFVAHIIELKHRWLLWADAAGLALFAVVGAEVALAHGTSGMVAIGMGVMTATFGGIIRDVLCQETSLVLQQEIYATAAVIGAGSYVVMTAWLQVDRPLAVAIAFGTGFIIRALAIVFRLSLPGYRRKSPDSGT